MLMDVPCTPRAVFFLTTGSDLPGSNEGQGEGCGATAESATGTLVFSHVGGSESHGEPQVLIPRNLAMDQ